MVSDLAVMKRWINLYRAMGIYEWPGYATQSGAKVARKSRTLPRDRVPFLTQVTTLPDPRGWWPSAYELIGHVPGLATPALIAVDLDTPESFASLADAEPGSPHVTSGRGGHVYFRMPEFLAMKPPSARPRLAAGVQVPGTSHVCEVFGTGKWVVLPPSVHPKTGRPYEWGGAWKDGATSLEDIPLAPDWVVDGITSRSTAESSRWDSAARGTAHKMLPRESDVETALYGLVRPSAVSSERTRQLISETAAAPPGDRHDRMLRVSRDFTAEVAAGRATAEDITAIVAAFTESYGDQAREADFWSMAREPVASVSLFAAWRGKHPDHGVPLPAAH